MLLPRGWGGGSANPQRVARDRVFAKFRKSFRSVHATSPSRLISNFQLLTQSDLKASELPTSWQF